MTTNTVLAGELDLYRDIHKALRNALFGVTLAVGRLDVVDRDEVFSVAEEVHRVMDLLASHHLHEDQPALEHLVDLLGVELRSGIRDAHQSQAAAIENLASVADELAAAPVERRRAIAHGLYLDFAAFTAEYLAHLDLEERSVMPALVRACSAEELLGVHMTIVAGIPIDEKCRAASYMLPALNVDERTAALGQIKSFAPPDIFERLRRVAETVLSSDEYRQLSERLAVS